MIWVLIATTWVLTDASVLVNVTTQPYTTEAACETARLEWKPPQPVTTWATQCQKMARPPSVNIKVESKS